MKSFDEWRLNECGGNKDCACGCKTAEKDRLGGLIPPDKRRAKHVDLVTLPKSIPGTNCGNCKYYKKHGSPAYKEHHGTKIDGEHGYCNHHDVEFHVSPRQCCKYWWNDKALRSF